MTWVHPDDVVNWVHADNLAEMVYLVLTRGQAGDVFHAVDANIPETDFRMRLIEASGKPYQVPNRDGGASDLCNDKIRSLGYRPVRSFDETMDVLLALFSLPRLKRECHSGLLFKPTPEQHQLLLQHPNDPPTCSGAEDAEQSVIRPGSITGTIRATEETSPVSRTRHF